MVNLSKEGSFKKSTESRIFAAINVLLGSIQSASEVLLQSINTTDLVAQTVSPVVLENNYILTQGKNVFEAMTKVMGYGTHLRSTLENSPLDHSALLALARSTLDALSAESVYLVALRRHAQTFNDLVSLTSGLGLFEVWSSLYAEGSSYFANESLNRLDELATSLNNDVERASTSNKYEFFVYPLKYIRSSSTDL